MLLSIAVLLLLGPLSSLQTPTSLKRNTTGTSLPSPGVTLSLPKSVTTTVNLKQKTQSPPSTPKSNPVKVNQTLSSSPPAKSTPAIVAKVLKEKAAPSPHPIKVVITDGCAQKDQKKESVAHETELMLKPGSPLVMTHHINLVPGSCTGGCEAEMATLKGRVEHLEKEMTAMKKMCMT